jgi:hypothetical protein
MVQTNVVAGADVLQIDHDRVDAPSIAAVGSWRAP